MKIAFPTSNRMGEGAILVLVHDRETHQVELEYRRFGEVSQRELKGYEDTYHIPIPDVDNVALQALARDLAPVAAEMLAIPEDDGPERWEAQHRIHERIADILRDGQNKA